MQPADNTAPRRPHIGFNACWSARAELGLEAAAIGALIVWALAHGRPGLAIVSMALPLLWRSLFVALATFGSWLAYRTPESTPPLSRAWFGVVARGGLALLRNQWALAFPAPMATLPAPDGRAPIVALIHGYACNHGCFLDLPDRLTAAGAMCVVIDLSNPIGDLDVSAAETAAWLKAVAETAGPRPVVVVGISMGGIVARRALARPEAPRVDHLVTISSPHAGTWLARFAIGRAGRQLRAITQREDTRHDTKPAVATTAIWTPDDDLILPPISATLAGATNVAVPGFSHFSVVSAPDVEAAILRAVRCATMSGKSRKMSI